MPKIQNAKTFPSEKDLPEIQIGKHVSAVNPKVSVIVPVYNVSKYISETLHASFSQTYTDFEVIVVNDGSEDEIELEKALEPFFDKIIYVKQKNAGVSAARNLAISLSRGELLAFLDGDDVWNKDFLESQIDYLERENLEMVYSDALIVGEPFFEGKNYMDDAPSDGAVTTLSLISGECNVLTSGTVLRKYLIERFGGFDTKFSGMEDFDLWFRFAKSGAKIGYQKQVLLKYRVRTGNLTGDSVKRSERNIFALKAIDEKYGLSEKEKAIFEEKMIECEAELELEKGKQCLLNGNFRKARAHFAEANKYYSKPKLYLMNLLIGISPRLAVTLFKLMRPEESAFIAPHKR